MNTCWKRLPLDIIKHILSYDENIVIRKWGEIVYIGRIPQSDPRYTILLTKPLIVGNRVYLPIPHTFSCLLLMVYREMIDTDTNDPYYSDHYFVDVLKIQRIHDTYMQKVLYTISMQLV
jgi:hypothetical protein